MHRLRYILLVGTPWLAACVVGSKSLGQGESSSDDGSGSETHGNVQCPQQGRFNCTVPYDGVELGACGAFALDENCCGRADCTGAADCADNEACVPVGGGFSCADEAVGGQTVCDCTIDNSGSAIPICLPREQVPVDWCAGYTQQAECDGAEPIDRSESDIQFCRWIEVVPLTLDVEQDTCSLTTPEPRCLTIQQGFDPGCAGEPCGIGIEPLSLGNPYARFVSETNIEVFGVDDVFCGGGFPVGDWVHADDPSLGQCAFTCGFDNPCAQPFEPYVERRAEASEDDPVDDCGDVDLDSPLTDWQAAHDCALEHAMTGQGFRLLWQGQSIDSIVRFAAIGLQAEAYAVALLHTDSGAEGGYVLLEEDGSGLEEVNACALAVGEMCLVPTASGEPVQLCGPGE
jgi:hypothetical protein